MSFANPKKIGRTPAVPQPVHQGGAAAAATGPRMGATLHAQHARLGRCGRHHRRSHHHPAIAGLRRRRRSTAAG